MPSERADREPVLRGEARPVDDAHVGHRDPLLGQHLPDDRGAAGRRAVALRGAELLEDELGGEVVAPAVHVAEDLPERRRGDVRDRHRRLAGDALPRLARDLHAGVLQRPLEERGRGQGRPVRKLSVEDAAVDGERRERRRLAVVEIRLPSPDAALCVEVALVPDDRARHAADPEPAHHPGQVLQVLVRERRVAASAEDEVPAPGLADLPAVAEHVRRDPIRPAEDVERGEGDRQLLVRRRLHGGEAALLVQDLPRLEVDRDGRSRRSVQAADGERPRRASG